MLAAVDGAGDAYSMHDRVDGDRPLAFAFVLGGGLRSWRAIAPRQGLGCRRRTIEAPAAQRALVGRAGLPLRWGAPARRSTQRSSAPRPDRERGWRGRMWLLAHASESQVRLQSSRIKPAASTPVTRAIAAKEGRRCGRSRRRAVEGVEMRTFGEQQGRERSCRESRFLVRRASGDGRGARREEVRPVLVSASGGERPCS